MLLLEDKNSFTLSEFKALKHAPVQCMLFTTFPMHVAEFLTVCMSILTSFSVALYYL